VQILIMDSGVNSMHPALSNEKFDGFGLIYDESSGECTRIPDFEDNIGHGTAVFHLIRKACPTAEIKVVKIFNDYLTIPEAAFIEMLCYVSKYEKPDILNLSLGLSICHDIESLFELCKEIYNKGTLIVSAFDNNGAISYPAAFDCVCGVTGIREITNTKQMIYIQDSYIDICAKGTVIKLAWKNPDYVLLAGNSFTNAMVTGNIATQLINGEITPDHILTSSELLPEIRKPSFTIKKAAIFPLNKEMHSLIRFPHLLSFELVDVYEHRNSGRVSKAVRNILNIEEAPDLIVQDIENICWDGFDTLILGHTYELSRLTGDFEINKRLIDSAKQHGVNVYAFDPNPGHGHVFFPEVNENYLPSNHFGKLFKINKPVLGVWGTSSQQGKFTMQLKLRELLKKKGYQVGQLGTEPSALLFGMDEVFPYGYNSAISLNETDAILYINRLMNNIARSDCEIIITGAQSATISYDLNNIAQFTTYQQSYLYATQPDAVILTVSPYDDELYIKRTIKYIEGIADCKVIALCLFPKFIQANEVGFNEKHEILSIKELEKYKIDLQEVMQLMVFIMGAEETALTDHIVDFFDNTS